MFRKPVLIAAAVLLLSAIPAAAQQYGFPGLAGGRTAGFTPSRPGGIFNRGGYAGTRSTVTYFGLAYGFGTDYSGNYYRATPDLGYYYEGYYYPHYTGETLRTPLSGPPSVLVPIPDLAAPSRGSPTYTYPDLINPSTNPTIRPTRR